MFTLNNKGKCVHCGVSGMDHPESQCRLSKEREQEIRSKYFCVDDAHKELLSEIDALREHISELQEEVEIDDFINDQRYERESILRNRIVKLKEAMRRTVARADDFADSHLSQPVRSALSEDEDFEK